jgi:hypothetical protein
VHLLAITPQDPWEDSPDKRAFAAVTRVRFGGRYDVDLALIGGPPPAWSGAVRRGDDRSARASTSAHSRAAVGPTRSALVTLAGNGCRGA